MLNYEELFEELEEMKSPIYIEKKIINKFIDNTKKHIEAVNKYGALIDRSYPDHDNSKLEALLYGYCFLVKDPRDRTPQEERLLDIATLIHITNTPHHPEYWTDTPLTGFTRKNVNPNGIIDATQMPLEYLEELCCDWKAMSDFYGNTIEEWFASVNGKRWLFTPEQQDFLRNTMYILKEKVNEN